MAKKKFYVVWVGNNPGIYETWQECQEQISGFPQAQYKSFKTLEEAKLAFEGSPNNYIGKEAGEGKIPLTAEQIKQYGKPIGESIAVDGAASGKTKLAEYQGVFTETKTPLFHAGPYEDGTNNIAEFLAIVHALAYCKKHNLNYPIYSDSRTAMSWVRNKSVKTTQARTPKNEQLFQLIQRALNWLESNQYQNKILKWETKAWGENPADFGRK